MAVVRLTVFGVVGRAGVGATTPVVVMARGQGPGVSPEALPAVVHHAVDPVDKFKLATDFATMEDNPSMAAVPVQQLFVELAVNLVSTFLIVPCMFRVKKHGRDTNIS